jgi:methionine-rich copper-binding protein CopC
MVIRCTLVSAALAAGLLAPLGAEAHAFLKVADPRVGSMVAKPPTTIRLTFTEGVEVPFCRVTVTGPSGFGGAGPPHAVPGDAASLSVDLRGPAPAGTYTVRWRALSVDTHATQGDFSFQVRPAVRQDVRR